MILSVKQVSLLVNFIESSFMKIILDPEHFWMRHQVVRAVMQWAMELRQNIECGEYCGGVQRAAQYEFVWLDAL